MRPHLDAHLDPQLATGHQGHSRTVVGIERRPKQTPTPAAQRRKDVSSSAIASLETAKARAQAARLFFPTAAVAGASGGSVDPARGGSTKSECEGSGGGGVQMADRGSWLLMDPGDDRFTYNLLVLDPGISSRSLWEALRLVDGSVDFLGR